MHIGHKTNNDEKYWLKTTNGFKAICLKNTSTSLDFKQNAEMFRSKMINLSNLFHFEKHGAKNHPKDKTWMVPKSPQMLNI